MTKKELKANGLLLITAAIWGFAFVAQRVGSEYLGAFTFNGIRFALGSISLIPLILIIDKKGSSGAGVRDTVKAGIIAGCILFFSSSFQQIGVTYTTAGKAGFITGLYMVIVPVIGIFMKQRTGKGTWVAIVFAIAGLYLLSINDSFSISKGDLLVLIGSLGWAVHILVIDKFTQTINPIKLSSVQFATCAILSIIVAISTESITMEGIKGGFTSILYGGFLSVGVAYTLQAVAQKNARPSHAAILLSMESVFSAIGGALMLNERLGVRGLIGCVLIFIGIIITQIKGKE